MSEGLTNVLNDERGESMNSDDLKFAWRLIRSCNWFEGEEERIKTCSTHALKLVLGRIRKDKQLFCDAYDQTGWKFEQELKRREAKP